VVVRAVDAVTRGARAPGTDVAKTVDRESEKSISHSGRQNNVDRSEPSFGAAAAGSTTSPASAAENSDSA
jgi:hypothetical protein